MYMIITRDEVQLGISVRYMEACERSLGDGLHSIGLYGHIFRSLVALSSFGCPVVCADLSLLAVVRLPPSGSGQRTVKVKT